MSKQIVTPSTSIVLAHREQWLRALADEISPWFDVLGHKLPSYRVGVGFPSSGKKGKRVGECWSAELSADKHNEIILHPRIAEAVEIAATLAHELTHAAVGIEAKHGSKFKKVAIGIGLEGPMRMTIAGDKFRADIDPIIKKLGPYPHGALDTINGISSRGPKQKNRMIKASCPVCKYIIRASRACYELGVPKCPNPNCELSWQEMELEAPDMLVEAIEAEEESEGE